jgi:hypothetical protein
MCAWCRQVQSPDGRWQSVESFIESRLPMEFTHGICPACLDEQEQPFHVDRPGPELRRSERVLLTAAVTLRSATLEHPAETLVVSRHGALLSSPVTHPEGATLSLTHVDSGASVVCRVVWSGVDECPGQHKIGIELIEERAEFWGAEYEAKLSEG